MATEAQILANRRNALHSTGPRSAEGKSVSRFNALKTGIQAKLHVIPGEDPTELEQLTQGYHQQFQPANPIERFLVDTLINSEWQLRRLRQVEARLWEQSLTADADLGAAYEQHEKTFTRLHRRLEALERSYYRALKELNRLQAEPSELDLAPDSRPLAPDFQPPAPQPSPASIGFVPPHLKMGHEGCHDSPVR